MFAKETESQEVRSHALRPLRQLLKLKPPNLAADRWQVRAQTEFYVERGEIHIGAGFTLEETCLISVSFSRFVRVWGRHGQGATAPRPQVVSVRPPNAGFCSSMLLRQVSGMWDSIKEQYRLGSSKTSQVRRRRIVMYTIDSVRSAVLDFSRHCHLFFLENSGRVNLSVGSGAL